MQIDNYIRHAIQQFISDYGLKPGSRLSNVAHSTLRSYTRNEPARQMAHVIHEETYEKLYEFIETYLPNRPEYYSRSKLIKECIKWKPAD